MRFNTTLSAFLILVIFLLSCENAKNSNQAGQWDLPKDSSQQAPISSLSFNQKDRTSWQNPSLILNHLGSLENKVVADIGAGMGYFTFLMAENGAQVIAVDIEPEFIHHIQTRREESALYNRSMIETRLSEPQDPALGPDEVDVALMVNTYPFLPDRIEYLKKIDVGLKPKGILCIVDYKSDRVPVIALDAPVLPADIVEKEMIAAGFRILVKDTSSLEYQYIITAVNQ